MSAEFQDLIPRVITALALIGIALISFLGGALSFILFTSVVIGIMYFELASFPEILKLRLPKNFQALIIGFIGFLSISFGFVLVSSPANHLLIILVTIMIIPTLVVAGVQSKISLLYFSLMTLSGLGITIVFLENSQWILLMVFLVVMTDIGGYFFGRFIGGVKFVPSISPNKTWAGILGGWILAVLTGVVFVYSFTNLQSSLTTVLTTVLCISFFSQVGDISFSWIKRRAGVKNSSNLLPGHGGFIDRFDSLTGAGLFTSGYYVFVF